MYLFTHTLEKDNYLTIIVILLSLSATSLSYHIYLRWVITRNWNVYYSQTLIKSIIIILWGNVFPVYLILKVNNYYSYYFSFILGIVGGFIVIFLDRYIIMYFINKHGLRNSIFENINFTDVSNHRLNLIKHQNNYQSNHDKNNYKFYKKIEIKNINLTLSILIASMEELIFRGFLFKTALLLGSNSISKFLYIAFITVLFSISHISMGIPQVVAKFFLGLVTTTIVVLTDSVLGAIISHIMLNMKACKEMGKLNKFQTNKIGL